MLILDEPTSALGVKQAAVVLRYVAQARARGLGVIFITHNVHHAYPVGDAFTILNRGRTYGTFQKGDVSREEVLNMMAGGKELDELRPSSPSSRAPMRSPARASARSPRSSIARPNPSTGTDPEEFLAKPRWFDVSTKPSLDPSSRLTLLAQGGELRALIEHHR